MNWEKDFGDNYDPLSLGEGVSPVLFKEKLFIVWDHIGQSKLYALDTKTGKEVWQINRDENYTWATPIVIEIEGETQLIIPGRNKSIGYNIESGNIIWEIKGLNGSVIPSPVFDGELAFLMAGDGKSKNIQAINLKNAKGKLDSTTIAWSNNRNTSYLPSPLLKDGKLYYLKGSRSQLSCVDAKTGEIYYNALKPKGMYTIYASPVYANGNIYIIDRKGTCSVIKEGAVFQVIAQNKLNDNFDASLVIVGNKILLRGHKSLYCISK